MWICQGFCRQIGQLDAKIFDLIIERGQVSFHTLNVFWSSEISTFETIRKHQRSPVLGQSTTYIAGRQP